VSRGVLLLDRVTVLLLGVAVTAASAVTVLWGLGRWPGLGDQVDLGAARELPEHPRWPWGLGLVGAVAVLVGLRALLSHARRPRVRRVALPAPASASTRLRADLPAVASAAARALARSAQVETARGHVVVDRGTTVVEVVARVDASADLRELRRDLDRTREELAAVLPPGTTQLRARLDVHRSRVENARVR
jgi:hypothetical protein